MVPGIGVECVCLSLSGASAMLAKAGTVLDLCLVGGNRLRSRGMCEFLVRSFFFLFSRITSVLIGVLGFWGAVRALFKLRHAALGDDLRSEEGVTLLVRL